MSHRQQNADLFSASLEGFFDWASTDLDKALELTPKDDIVMFEIGRLHLIKGEMSEAMKSFDSSLDLNPANSRSKIFRSLIWSSMGQYDKAESDILDAGKDRFSPYVVMWLHVDRMKESKNDMASFINEAGIIPKNKWPYPIIQFFLGELSDKQLLDAAVNDDLDIRLKQICESHFYIGEQRLIQRNKSSAKDNFIAAKSLCPPTYVESVGANFELKNLH